MSKIIRLTENDLHNLIRKSVTRILKEEYGVAPNGRQINQQQAIQAANAPTNWEVYNTLAKKYYHQPNPVYGPSKSAKYEKMAQKAADNQMGYYKRGDSTSEYVYPNLKNGNTEYTQDNVDQLQDTEKDYAAAFFNDKRNVRTGYKNAQNPNNQGVYYPFPWGSRNPSDYQKPSPEATTAFNNAHNRMTNYVNGNWHQRMRQKAQQLGNKGIYESKK